MLLIISIYVNTICSEFNLYDCRAHTILNLKDLGTEENSLDMYLSSCKEAIGLIFGLSVIDHCYMYLNVNNRSSWV